MAHLWDVRVEGTADFPNRGSVKSKASTAQHLTLKLAPVLRMRLHRPCPRHCLPVLRCEKVSVAKNPLHLAVGPCKPPPARSPRSEPTLFLQRRLVGHYALAWTMHTVTPHPPYPVVDGVSRLGVLQPARVDQPDAQTVHLGSGARRSIGTRSGPGKVLSRSGPSKVLSRSGPGKVLRRQDETNDVHSSASRTRREVPPSTQTVGVQQQVGSGTRACSGKVAGAGRWRVAGTLRPPSQAAASLGALAAPRVGPRAGPARGSTALPRCRSPHNSRSMFPD